MNFWQQMPKPLFVLAPMADVTDAAFRQIIAKYSKPCLPAGGRALPYITYTEFVSADGLALAPEEGRQRLLKDLLFTDAERPIVAQFFTKVSQHMEKAAALAQEMGFDGVDINMGCPAEAIVGQGAGAKLILDPRLAQELIAAAKRGAPNLPVSVKTRLGYNSDVLDEWLPALLEAKPAAVIIHARTKKDMSKVPARWERIKRAVEIRDELKSEVLILGNGDVKDVEDAQNKIKETGADGVMIGRGIFGKPWLFASPDFASEKVLGSSLSGDIHQTIFSTEFRLRVLVEHTKLFEELLGGTKSFAVMKKHFKAYVEGFDGAKELRVELMEAENATEVEATISRFIQRAPVNVG